MEHNYGETHSEEYYQEREIRKQKEAFDSFTLDVNEEYSSSAVLSEDEKREILENEKKGILTAGGFGFFDACDYIAKPDDTAWIIKGVLPKNGFGFVAGPPKGGASPHGGKSVFNRKMAICIITGQPFFGHEVLEKGKALFVNLDEDQDKQVRLYYRMTKGEKIPGYLISRARSCRFPEHLNMLEDDIKIAKPIHCCIDPLQRVMGGKAVNEQADVGPIIDGLKFLSKQYGCTISVNHHSTKDQRRDKEATASWLSGSNDLDAAWDYCHCLEYNRDTENVHFRNFQKEKGLTNIFYEAEIINKDEIVDLYHVLEELSGSKTSRIIHHAVINNHSLKVSILAEKLGISRATFYREVEKVSLLKMAVRHMHERLMAKGVNVSHEDEEILVA